MKDARVLLVYALADLEGIMPEHEPSGDRNHPAWLTIKEIKEYLDAAPGTPAAFGETATGSLPPEVGQVFGGAQVYNRDGIRTGEADDPAQQKALAERAAVELIDAINAVLDQASERYPHFESERGQRTIKRARNAITEFLAE